ncbi:hypothetical protein M1523_03680 [Patescibacteria group bacterium]|nr:hypothetical protein [Patescibacteria group bacterium]MCL5091595.1 hypothetical protein [Patescibacteria group bacterium]
MTNVEQLTRTQQSFMLETPRWVPCGDSGLFRKVVNHVVIKGRGRGARKTRIPVEWEFQQGFDGDLPYRKVAFFPDPTNPLPLFTLQTKTLAVDIKLEVVVKQASGSYLVTYGANGELKTQEKLDDLPTDYQAVTLDGPIPTFIKPAYIIEYISLWMHTPIPRPPINKLLQETMVHEAPEGEGAQAQLNRWTSRLY